MTMQVAVVVLSTFFLPSMSWSADIVVTGQSGPNRWESGGQSSANLPARIGNPAGRFEVMVKNGQIVSFVVASGSHRLLLENAVREQRSRVWEVVAGSGTLEELATGNFPHYDHSTARKTNAATGNLLRIRILNLGEGESILFACHPHSESPNGANVSMLGKLTGGSPTPVTNAMVSAELPLDVIDGDGSPVPVNVGNLPIDFFDNFSWRTFLALNWPAKSGVRGEADLTKNVGDAGPRVWETFKAGYEIVQPGGAIPSDWNSLDAVSVCPDVPPVGSGTVRVLGTFSKFGDFNQAGFTGEQNPLVAVNRSYVRFETRVNKPEFETIVNKQLYLKSKLDSLTEPLRFPDGSIEVKAAWRILKSSEPQDVIDSFYSIDAKVLNPITGMCEESKVGLVGLHIVHKTPRRPQWVWSSFEHKSNVPNTTHPSSSDRFSFNDPTLDQRLIPADAPPSVNAGNFSSNPDPMQVVRIPEMPIHPRTEATNARFQAKLGSTVWANYKLVMTQWPTRTRDENLPFPEDIDGSPFPDRINSTTAIANTTMETYEQKNTSCIDCHDIARVAKTDFVFFLHFKAFDDTQTPTPIASPVVSSLKAKLHSVRSRGGFLEEQRVKQKPERK